MGRDVKAKVPLAETTLDNLVAIMPGATMTESGGAVSTGTITVTTLPAAADTILVNGTTVKFVAALSATPPAGIVECLLGASAAATAVLLAATLNASTDLGISAFAYSVSGSVVTAKYGNQLVYGTTGQQTAAGNFTAFGAGTAGAKVTLVQPTGGTEPTARSVTVATGVSKDLLSFAKELRLHPTSLPVADRTQDFVIPFAATGGALSFAYKVDAERIYQVEFTGYPDPSNASGKLFTIGL
jgi:hypothetical protein